ncbi:MAG: lactate utilization protein, partial [Youngiibacter sp.]|nr:lactate utilization protein [Youngiibacter sp.]
RTAAMIYGPDKVFVIIGLNKIVEDEVDAVSRVQGIAAPANNVRLNTGNPCTVSGTCMDCSSQARICNIYTLIRRQNVKDRIEVIIVKENMGY